MQKLEGREIWEMEWRSEVMVPELLEDMKLYDVFQAPPSVVIESAFPPRNWAECYVQVAEVHAYDLAHVAHLFCNSRNPWWTDPEIALLEATDPHGYRPDWDDTYLRHRALRAGDVVVEIDGCLWRPYAFLGVESGRFLPLW